MGGWERFVLGKGVGGGFVVVKGFRGGTWVFVGLRGFLVVSGFSCWFSSIVGFS